MSILDIEFVATCNEWDAPLTVFMQADGSLSLFREWAPASHEYQIYLHYPHANVLMHGRLSQFDQQRQPVETTECIEGS